MNSVGLEGGGGRDPNKWLQLKLNGIRFSHKVFSNGNGERTTLAVEEFEVVDGIETSRYNKVVAPLRTPTHSDTQAFNACVLHMPNYLETVRVHIAAHPLEINIDQDTAGFMIGLMYDDSVADSCDAESKEEPPLDLGT